MMITKPSRADFIRIAAKPPRRNRNRPENGVRGVAIRLPNGTCGLLNFDTGEVDVWVVGERPRDWETSWFSVDRETRNTGSKTTVSYVQG